MLGKTLLNAVKVEAKEAKKSFSKVANKVATKYATSSIERTESNLKSAIRASLRTGLTEEKLISSFKEQQKVIAYENNSKTIKILK